MDLKKLRKEYLSDRAGLEQEFLADRDSGKFLKKHTALLDRIISLVTKPVLEEHRLSIIAIGGYGRREMLPHSDVDLLVVHDSPDSDESNILRNRISSLITTLWDLIEDLGHQVWSVEELRNLDIKEHYEFVLALRDGRYVAGNRSLADTVTGEVFPAVFQGNRQFFVDIIHDEVRKRFAQQKFTIFHLEPDIKESPGGLRDHLAAGWLQDLSGIPAYLKHSSEDVKGAHQFMLGLRILLHVISGRNDNKLAINRQEKISFMVVPGAVEGKSSDEIRMVIEAFMKQYYINARILNDRCKTMLDVSRPADGSTKLHQDDLASPVNPLSVMRIFNRAAKERKKLSYSLKKRIAAAIPAFPENTKFPELKKEVELFFRPFRGMASLLWDMYDLGLLEYLVPEFGSIKARFCWDYYHRYTVDEHTILAIRNIERLTVGTLELDDKPTDDRFASLLEESSSPVDITLALLLHDVGKGQDGDHSVTGTGMAEQALKRLGFSPLERERITFLVLNHLAMSTVVFHRDHNDEKILNDFADLVSDTETLRCLTLLTYADVKAVGPGTLNGWKKDQLWDVYVKTYRKLTLGYGADRIDEDDLGIASKLVKGLPRDFNQAGFEGFLEGFPVSYLRTSPQKIYKHFELASGLSPAEPVQVSISSSEGLYELCVVTPDRRRLFARIAGMLSYFDMNIVRGYGFANRQDIVLDIFEFFDTEKRFRYSREKDRFSRMLHEVLTDRRSIREMLRQKDSSPLVLKMGPLEPVVYFENDPERKVTLMEIISPDKPGLLYSIGSVLSSLECDIELLLINTEGEKAVDVFYLRHNNGILPDEMKRRLEREILEAI